MHQMLRIGLVVCFTLSLALWLGQRHWLHWLSDTDSIYSLGYSYLQLMLVPWALFLAATPILFAFIGCGAYRQGMALTFWGLYVGLIALLALMPIFLGYTLLSAGIAASIGYSIGACGYLVMWGLYRRRERLPQIPTIYSEASV